MSKENHVDEKYPRNPSTMNGDTTTRAVNQFGAILDTTLNSAFDCRDKTRQVMELSGFDQYAQFHEQIMHDPDLTIEEKMRYKKELDAWQDKRTEKSKDNVNEMETNRVNNIIRLANGALVCFIAVYLGSTPSGQRFIANASKTVLRFAASYQ